MAKNPRSKSKSPSPRRLRITRVYTRTGDKGTTRLVGGQVLKKNHPRIEAYGTVDELSVALGHARDSLDRTIGGLILDQTVQIELWAMEDARPKSPGLRVSFAQFELLGAHLLYLQNLLFTLGGDLATVLKDRWPDMPVIVQDDITHLERLIDGYNASLPPLKDFILPGGGPLSLALHTCRVVCRRAERRVQALADQEDVGAFVVPFLNRLSDLFFVLGRWVVAELNRRGEGQPETIWNRALPVPPPPGTPKSRTR